MTKRNTLSSRAGAFLFLLFALSACTRAASPPPASAENAPKRYSLKGKVISLDKHAGTANIFNEPIQGFMDPMAMPYAIHPPSMLDQLQPGDTITADVVVEPDKYWLENVKVVDHAPPSPPAKEHAKDKK